MLKLYENRLSNTEIDLKYSTYLNSALLFCFFVMNVVLLFDITK